MNSAPNAVRLVIVEDDEHLLKSLTQIMLSQSDINVVGSYFSAEEAIETTDWLEVDVLLVDLGLPGISGSDLIAAAAFENPHLHSLVHTIHDDREALFAALRAGAIGYIIKGIAASEMLEVVRAVSNATPTLSPAVARFLIQEFCKNNVSTPEESLSAREVNLLTLSAQGLIYKEIAGKLSISPGTVHSHIKRIYRKLHARNRKEALSRAQKLGYLKPENQPDFEI